MCGVIGCFAKNGFQLNASHHIAVKQGLKYLELRGPDAQSIINIDNGNLILGHTRLAIIDLSPESNQPFTHDNKSFLSFNGEIYNFKELSKQYFRDEKLSTNSDTEILYYIFLKQMNLIKKIEGMFAGCFYDGENIMLFRDPMAIKPLYYYEDEEIIFFSSSLRLFKELEFFKNLELDQLAKTSFILNGHLDQGLTPFESTSEVKPGEVLTISPDGSKKSLIFDNSKEIFKQKEIKNFNLDFTSLIDCSVNKHLVSDVPVALMYSAGLDSNLIAKSMSKYTDVNAFTIGFDSFKATKYDEVPLAKKIAISEGYSFHHEYLSDEQILSNFNIYLDNLDTLSIDGLNTWMVCKYISSMGYKVAISGAGGDEIFQGYSNFLYIKWLNKFINLVPSFVRNVISTLIPSRNRKFRKLKNSIKANSIEELYFIKRSLFDIELICDYFDSDQVPYLYQQILDYKFKSFELPNVRNEIQVSSLEYHFYCRNQLLRDADWASMAHSLELRVPLVDKVLYQNAVALRNSYPMNDKYSYYEQYFPKLSKDLFSKQKTGFGIPLLPIVGGSDSYEYNYQQLLDNVFYSVTGRRI